MWSSSTGDCEDNGPSDTHWASISCSQLLTKSFQSIYFLFLISIYSLGFLLMNFPWTKRSKEFINSIYIFFFSMGSMGLIYTVLPAIVMCNSFDKICTEVIWSSDVLKLYLGIFQDSRRICETLSVAFGILYIEYIEGVFVRI